MEFEKVTKEHKLEVIKKRDLLLPSLISGELTVEELTLEKTN